MLARLGRGDRLFGVQAKRRRDIDGVNLRVGQQLAPVGIVLACAEFSRKTLGQFGAGAADRHQLARGRVLSAGATRFRAMSPQPIKPQ